MAGWWAKDRRTLFITDGQGVDAHSRNQEQADGFDFPDNDFLVTLAVLEADRVEFRRLPALETEYDLD